MKLSPVICYQAVLTRDRRFDGVFFTGVKTTKIYCRPVCTVKPPLLKNVSFYDNAASCERDGLRPCLRCRPELAPGSASVDAVSRLVAQAVSLIDDGLLTSDSIEQLASDLNVSSRHLRRVFETELGVSPIQYVQTQRLLLSKRLLTDTDLPVSHIAIFSGFASVRRFNALFKERYRLNPTQLRKSRLAKTSSPDTITCQIHYRPPYDWPSMLTFLKARACPGVEQVDDERYSRTMDIDGVKGWLIVEQSRELPALNVTVSASLAPKLLRVLNRLKRMFDLQAKPEMIETHLGKIAKANPGLRVPGACDPFEVSIRAILGQQVSVKAASSLAGRLAERFGEKIETPFEQLQRLAPRAETLAKARTEELSSLGILPARANTIINFARLYSDGKLSLHPGLDYETTIKRLMELPGVGEWTAEYIAMRCLAWPDAFPHGDLGIKKALGLSSKKEMLEEAEKFRPWRSYASMHLWKSLELNSKPGMVASGG